MLYQMLRGELFFLRRCSLGQHPFLETSTIIHIVFSEDVKMNNITMQFLCFILVDDGGGLKC